MSSSTRSCATRSGADALPRGRVPQRPIQGHHDEARRATAFPLVHDADMAQYLIALASTAVAALAILVNARTSRRNLEALERNQMKALEWQERSQQMQLRTQAAAALAERLWDRRAELYVRVMAWTERATEACVSWKREKKEMPDGTIDPPEEVFREVALFAPSHVEHQFTKARDRAHEFEWNTRRMAPDFLERELPNVYRELNRLREIVRVDIQGDRPHELPWFEAAASKESLTR
jgi:hypothetical protein